MACSGRHETVPAGDAIPRSGRDRVAHGRERRPAGAHLKEGANLLQTLKGDRRSCAQANGLISATFIAGAALSTLWKALGPFLRHAPVTANRGRVNRLAI